MAMLLTPVVLDLSALSPIAPLKLAKFSCNASNPIAVFDSPVTLVRNVSEPRAVLPKPVVVCSSELEPTAVLLPLILFVNAYAPIALS